MAVDGTWKITLNTPMGARDSGLELASAGASLSGKLSSDMGTQEFANGKIDGDNLEWTVSMSGPMGAMDLAFKGAVDGDKISGSVQFGSFGGGSFSGSRA